MKCLCGYEAKREGFIHIKQDLQTDRKWGVELFICPECGTVRASTGDEIPEHIKKEMESEKGGYNGKTI